jgi:hypothetical protein
MAIAVNATSTAMPTWNGLRRTEPIRLIRSLQFFWFGPESVIKENRFRALRLNHARVVFTISVIQQA